MQLLAWLWIFLLLVASLHTGFAVANRLLTLTSVEDFMGTCMLGTYHKGHSSKEDKLHNHCHLYASKSCCSYDTSIELHEGDLYKFNYSHCGKTMSAGCKSWFQRVHCAYACSPNLGPYLVKVGGFKSRRERNFNVPLCQSQCDSWYNACKDDLTCVTDWTNGFVWQNSTNECPGEAKCDTIANTFKNNSTTFCELVWDDEWDVVSDDFPCFLLDWSPELTDPNERVALMKARKIVALINHSTSLLQSSCCMCFILLIFSLHVFNVF